MGRLLYEDDVIDAINKRISVLQKHPEFRRKHADIDLYGIKPMIAELPPAQPQYEELKPEEAASEIASGSIMSAAYWLDLMIRLKQLGFAICRKKG